MTDVEIAQLQQAFRFVLQATANWRREALADPDFSEWVRRNNALDSVVLLSKDLLGPLGTGRSN